MAKEYIVYCDESDRRGKYYSNFYGGALVCSSRLEEIVNRIQQKMTELNMHQEVKWSKVTQNYSEKYIELMQCFFDLVKNDLVKIRIMFTQKHF